MYTFVSFISVWTVATIFCERNDVMKHLCDEVFWRMKHVD